MPFTEDQMHRPLFEEPAPEIERQDAWEGPHGFLFGGMANLKLPALGQQYFDAAHHLVEVIAQKEVEDYRLGNPIVYLYRHSIELFLKAVLPDKGRGARHDLAELSERFEKLVHDEFDVKVPRWIIDRLKELAELDPDSTTFRYNQNPNLVQAGEYHVDLFHLRDSMAALNTALVGLLAALERGEGKGGT